MKKSHFVVVVGGGPAGSSAAYTLAKQGIDVCIIDKSTFPRNKLCGGLLTLRSKKVFEEIFDANWEKNYEYRSTGFKILNKNTVLNGAENYKEVFFTNRFNYDYLLLSHAKEAGTISYEGEGVISLDLQKKICKLKSGKEISYNYIIGADGINSVVAKSIFGNSFNPKTVGFALEIEVDKKLMKREVTVPEMYFGVVNWGYGWVFPKENTLTIGIGGLNSKNTNMRKKLNDFLKGLFGEIPDAKIKGHFIPFGDYRKVPGAKDTLLVGDAAGLVDPITGEGIAFAMESGYLAAQAIIKSKNEDNGIDVLAIYKKLYSKISTPLNYAKFLRYLIFPLICNKLLVKLLPKSKTLSLKHMDLMSDDIEYREYAKHIATKVVKVIVKKVLFIK